MSNFQPKEVVVPGSVAEGTPVDVNPRSPVAFSLGGTFVATVKFQYSPTADGTDWYDVGSALTAAGLQMLPAGKAMRVRANTTAWTSGTPLASIMSDTAGDVADIERTFQSGSIAVPVVISTAGAELVLDGGEQATIHVNGTFVGTYQAQVCLSAAGSVWHDWGRPLTATGSIRIPRGLACRVRLYASAYTSGTPAGTYLRGFAHEDGDDGVIESIVAPGALSVFARTSLLSIDATDAFTLADGLVEGQRKTIVVIAATSTPRGTVTCATKADSEAAPVLTSVGQRIEYEWHDIGGWRIVGFNNRDGSAVDALSGAAALSLNTLLSTLAVSGTIAYTLADGLYAGQQKWVRCISVAATPHGTLTPATPSGFASIEFNTAEDFALLLWTGAAWIIVASQGLTVNP